MYLFIYFITIFDIIARLDIVLVLIFIKFNFLSIYYCYYLQETLLKFLNLFLIKCEIFIGNSHIFLKFVSECPTCNHIALQNQ